MAAETADPELELTKAGNCEGGVWPGGFFQCLLVESLGKVHG